MPHGSSRRIGGMTRRARACLAAATTLVALGTLAACGDDDADEAATDGADETTTTAPAAEESTTSTTLPPEDQVWADLTAAYEAISDVAADPDPNAPELAEHHTGRALDLIQSTMRDLQAGGPAESAVTLHRYAVSVSGEAATVDYCFVDTSQYFDLEGNPVGSEEVTSMRADGKLEHVDGTWKISQVNLEPEPCPAS
jgi:ABC-type glycerol-3-phosphate transport system substrate-binding protein